MGNPTSGAFANPVVIINAASGSTSDISEDITILIRNYLSAEAACHYVEPGDLDDALSDAITGGADLIITYGGDGTSMTALRLANAKDIPVLPLPGGTMNVLPKSLYGSDNWQDVLETALGKGEPSWIPAGEIEGQTFVVAAMFGSIVNVGKAREMVRERKIFKALQQVAGTLMSSRPANKFTYETANGIPERAANLLQLTCPNMGENAVMDNAFELVSINVDTLSDIPSMGLTALVDEWRASDKTHVSNARNVTISGEGSGKAHLDALLDGEPARLGLPVTVTFKKKGALVLR